MEADGAVEFEQVEADPATGGTARKAPLAGMRWLQLHELSR